MGWGADASGGVEDEVLLVCCCWAAAAAPDDDDDDPTVTVPLLMLVMGVGVCVVSSEMGVPNRADDRLESSTTTRAKLGKVETFDEVAELEEEGPPSAVWAVWSGFGEACLSERRNGEREKVGSLRNVDEPGIEVRCRPVR